MFLERLPNSRGKFKCSYCGNIFETQITYIVSGHTSSCGCIKSKGEEKISKILVSLNIPFKKEKYFKDCKNPKTNTYLYFDFYLPQYNCLIEYDGEQHYIARGWNNELKVKDTQYRDSIKNKYCKDNNIKLIRIPYWDFEKINSNYLFEKIAQLTG